MLYGIYTNLLYRIMFSSNLDELSNLLHYAITTVTDVIPRSSEYNSLHAAGIWRFPHCGPICFTSSSSHVAMIFWCGLSITGVTPLFLCVTWVDSSCWYNTRDMNIYVISIRFIGFMFNKGVTSMSRLEGKSSLHRPIGERTSKPADVMSSIPRD